MAMYEITAYIYYRKRQKLLIITNWINCNWVSPSTTQVTKQTYVFFVLPNSPVQRLLKQCITTHWSLVFQSILLPHLTGTIQLQITMLQKIIIDSLLEQTSQKELACTRIQLIKFTVFFNSYIHLPLPPPFIKIISLNACSQFYSFCTGLLFS